MTIKPPDDSVVISQQSPLEQESLSPGKSLEITFFLDVGDQFKGESELPLSIGLITDKPHTSYDHTVKLAFSAEPAMAVASPPLTRETPSVTSAVLSRITQFSSDAIKGLGSLFGKISPVIQPGSENVNNLPAATIVQSSKRYAIVIGIEIYRQNLPRADYAVSDAKLVSQYLINVLGYPERNIILLLNENAARNDMEKYFGTWLRNNVESGSTVFIYYSGHGAPNPKTGDAYLVPFDGDPTFITDTGYSLNALYANLAKLPAKKIIVALDSCFSGAGGKSVLAKGARPLVVTTNSAQLPAKNIAILAASSANQISSTYNEKGHGLFTYFLLMGIKESLEKNKDAKLEINKMFDYLKPNVESISRRVYNNEQTPQLIVGDELLKKSGLD